MHLVLFLGRACVLLKSLCSLTVSQRRKQARGSSEHKKETCLSFPVLEIGLLFGMQQFERVSGKVPGLKGDLLFSDPTVYYLQP